MPRASAVRRLMLLVVALAALLAPAVVALARNGGDRAPGPGASDRIARGGDGRLRGLPSAYVLPGERVFPEGIARERGTPFFYVSSTTDGTIFRGRLGRRRTEVFLPGGADGRTTAVGLRVDRAGHLIVAGGATGRIFVYSTTSGRLQHVFETGAGGFLNDVAVTRDGDAYITDSRRPVLFRLTAAQLDGRADAPERLAPYRSLAGSPIAYDAGFNLNGIVARPNGRYLLTVQSSTGRLYRVSTGDGAITEVDLGGVRLTNGDGLLLAGRTLYAVRNQQEQIVEIRLGRDARRGRVRRTITSPRLAFPTTVDRARGRLLVVNSQFDRRESTPELPFTVAVLRRR